MQRGSDDLENYIKTGKIQVSQVLFDFVNLEVLPGSGLDRESFGLI
ncbi:hypothetical protein N752_08250 [Desulforamulus aquiferis]|nr:hypothetical protein N752_08250 [Desulforamulus aquiferis]